jgi:hypothetical protein
MGIIKSTASRLIDLSAAIIFIKKLAVPFTSTDAYKLGIIDHNGNRTNKPLISIIEKQAWTYLDVICNNLKKLLAKLPGGKTRFATLAACMLLLREDNIKEDKLEFMLNEYLYSIESIMEIFGHDEFFKDKAILHQGKIYTRHNFRELDKKTPSLIHHDDIADALSRHLKVWPTTGQFGTVGGHPFTRGLIAHNGKFYSSDEEDKVIAAKKARSITQQFHEDGETVAINNVGGGNIAGVGVGPRGEPPVTLPAIKKYKKANKKGELNVSKIVLGMVKR